MQTATSVQVNLTFSNDITGTSGCFFDKLTFTRTSTDNAGFMPLYPGLCEFGSGSRNTLAGIMDVRDFARALQFQILTAVSNTNILIRGESSVSLIPGVLVRPTSTPLRATIFNQFIGSSSLISFDFDLSTDQIILHFDGLIDTSSVNIALLTLSNDATNFVTLTPSTSQHDPYATTLCVTLATADSTRISEQNICNRTCFCSTVAGFAIDYNGNDVMTVNSLEVITIMLVCT